jgi:hypothetical protein
MRRIAILVLLASLGCQQLTAQASKTPDPWARLSFLFGEWEGVGSGAPGEVEGGTTFALALDKNILLRKNWAKSLPKPGEKTGLTHEDLMIIYPTPDGSPYRAIYFDNEGHVINYLVSFPQKPEAAVFETEPAQKGKGPRFRLTYELSTDGTLNNVFLIAGPGEEFKVYTQGKLMKTRSGF